MEIVEIKLRVFTITNISNQANSTGWIRFYLVDGLSEAALIPRRRAQTLTG